MLPEALPRHPVAWGRWTPARMIVLGAAMGFGPVVLDAGISLGANLALLQGSIGVVPYWLALANAALVGVLVPTGLFLALCGIALHLRAQHPPGRSRAFRAARGGAGLNLAAGLLLGFLNFSFLLLPEAMFTLDFVRNAVIAIFAASVTAAVGLMIAFFGIAAMVREEPQAAPPRAFRLRAARGKDIYRVAPSAR